MQHTEGIKTIVGAGDEEYFSENHHISQGLLSLIVGGLNIRVFEEGKQAMLFFFWIDQSF